MGIIQECTVIYRPQNSLLFKYSPSLTLTSILSSSTVSLRILFEV